MKKEEMITKNDLIGDIVKNHPLAVETIQDNGIQFIGKHIALRQTLEQAASEDRTNLHNLLDELNNQIRG